MYQNYAALIKKIKSQNEIEQESHIKNSFVGTQQYVSPEMLSSSEIRMGCDWWAFAIILY